MSVFNALSPHCVGGVRGVKSLIINVSVVHLMVGEKWVRTAARSSRGPRPLNPTVREGSLTESIVETVTLYSDT